MGEDRMGEDRGGGDDIVWMGDERIGEEGMTQDGWERRG